MVTLLHFVHRQKLLEPANPDFQIDITNARNVYRQHSFRIKMNGTHRKQSDHTRFHILLRETCAKHSVGRGAFATINDQTRGP